VPESIVAPHFNSIKILCGLCVVCALAGGRDYWKGSGAMPPDPINHLCSRVVARNANEPPGNPQSLARNFPTSFKHTLASLETLAVVAEGTQPLSDPSDDDDCFYYFQK